MYNKFLENSWTLTFLSVFLVTLQGCGGGSSTSPEIGDGPPLSVSYPVGTVSLPFTDIKANTAGSNLTVKIDFSRYYKYDSDYYGLHKHVGAFTDSAPESTDYYFARALTDEQPMLTLTVNSIWRNSDLQRDKSFNLQSLNTGNHIVVTLYKQIVHKKFTSDDNNILTINFQGKLTCVSSEECDISAGVVTKGTLTFENNNFLAGHFLYAPNSNSSSIASTRELVSYVRGNDSFNNIQNLTGEARYEGYALGSAIKENQDVINIDNIGYFDGIVNLRAIFSNVNSPEIRGELFSANWFQGVNLFTKLTFATLTLKNNQSTGTGDLYYGDSKLGFWSANFFGNGPGSTDKPSAVAGTLGGILSKDTKDWKIWGAFGAYKYERLGNLINYQLGNNFPNVVKSCGGGCYAHASSDMLAVEMIQPQKGDRTISLIAGFPNQKSTLEYTLTEDDFTFDLKNNNSDIAGRGVITSIDIDTSGNNNSTNDYLLGGVWLVAPKYLSSIPFKNDNIDKNTHFGAFVFHPKQSQTTIPNNLQTEVKYYGNIHGLFMPKRQDTVNLGDVNGFEAKIALTAQFNDQPSISGKINGYTNLLNELNANVRYLPDLTFNIPINSDTSTDFKGDLLNGSKTIGSLNGKFYGNGTEDKPPYSVAGTFSAIAAEAMMAGTYIGIKE